jgi:hypothetical protein
MDKYLNFNITTRSGFVHINPGTLRMSEEPLDFLDYHVPVELAYEWLVTVDGIVDYNYLFDGYASYPLHTFNEEKYKKGEPPFEEFDPYDHEYFKSAKRRLMILDDIHSEVLFPTEFKKLRKALLAVVKEMKLEKLPEVEEYLGLSDFIETKIKKYPKEQTLKKIDLQESAGVEHEDKHGKIKNPGMGAFRSYKSKGKVVRERKTKYEKLIEDRIIADGTHAIDCFETRLQGKRIFEEEEQRKADEDRRKTSKKD